MNFSLNTFSKSQENEKMDFLDGNIHLKSRAGVLVLFTLQANLYTGTAIASRKSICNLGMHARSLSIISIGVIPMPFSCEEKKERGIGKQTRSR